jgi:hypothetical protein
MNWRYLGNTNYATNKFCFYAFYELKNINTTSAIMNIIKHYYFNKGSIQIEVLSKSTLINGYSDTPFWLIL